MLLGGVERKLGRGRTLTIGRGRDEAGSIA
jgi:hypothetical protein